MEIHKGKKITRNICNLGKYKFIYLLKYLEEKIYLFGGKDKSSGAQILLLN